MAFFHAGMRVVGRKVHHDRVHLFHHGRLVRPGGRLILVETLGTGESTPKVIPFFRIVYDYLEQEASFTPLYLRTDYRFETMQQIRQVELPLFGQGMLPRLVETLAGWVLPECTGLWWRNLTH